MMEGEPAGISYCTAGDKQHGLLFFLLLKPQRFKLMPVLLLELLGVRAVSAVCNRGVCFLQTDDLAASRDYLVPHGSSVDTHLQKSALASGLVLPVEPQKDQTGTLRPGGARRTSFHTGIA